MHLGWWWGVWADGDSFPWVVTARTLQFVKFLWNKPNQNRLCHIPIVHWWAPLALNIQWFNCSLSLSNPSLLSLLRVLVAQLLLANGIFILAQGSVVAFPFSIPSLHSSSLFIRFFIQPCPESLCSKQVACSHATAEANHYKNAIKDSDEKLSHNFWGNSA